MFAKRLSLRYLRRFAGLASLAALVLLALAPMQASATQPCLKLPTISPLAGLTLVNDVNASVLALSNAYSGSSAPTTSGTCQSGLAGMVWHDTATNTLKVRDQADSAWIVVGTFDETGKTFTAATTAASQYAADTGSANAYAIAPTPAFTAYAAGQLVFFKAANANTGASTLNASTLGNKALVRRDGSALKQNDILGASLNIAVYDGTAFQLLTATVQPPIVVRGARANLKIIAGSGAKTSTITADAVALADTTGAGWLASGVSVTLNLASSGAGGLDSGSDTGNTWYAVWLIDDAGVVKALASTSATAPTMPSGDIYKARIGWERTDVTGNVIAFVQLGDRGRWLNMGTGLPLAASGVAGSFTAGTYASFSVSTLVPPTATAIGLILFSNNGVTAAAPDANYGPYNSSSNPPFCSIVVSSQPESIPCDVALQTGTTVYWFGSNSASALYAAGWIDGL
jgi:hypothetical protein